MSDPSTSAAGHVRAFGDHLFYLPAWQKTAVILAALLAAAGVAVQALGWFSGQNEPSPTTATHNSSAPAGRSFATTPTEEPTSTDAAKPGESALLQRLSPGMTHMGVGFGAGLLIGWLFRAFVKTVSFILGIGVAIMLALSYFHVINVDFSSVEKQYASALSWAIDQGHKMVALVMAHFPGSSSSALGMFIGFRRR